VCIWCYLYANVTFSVKSYCLLLFLLFFCLVFMHTLYSIHPPPHYSIFPHTPLCIVYCKPTKKCICWFQVIQPKLSFIMSWELDKQITMIVFNLLLPGLVPTARGNFQGSKTQTLGILIGGTRITVLSSEEKANWTSILSPRRSSVLMKYLKRAVDNSSSSSERRISSIYDSRINFGWSSVCILIIM